LFRYGVILRAHLLGLPASKAFASLNLQELVRLSDFNLSVQAKKERQEKERRLTAELAAKLVGKFGWPHGIVVDMGAARFTLIVLLASCVRALQRRSGQMQQSQRLPV
jgi:hypothetical protein